MPAGAALAVDRELFAGSVTERIESHPRINVVRREVTEIPDTLCIIASGPLTSEALVERIVELTGQQNLAFFDAIAPIVEHATIDMRIAFRASRRDHGESTAGDYINCPMDEEQYHTFVESLRQAEKIPLRGLEAAIAGGVRAGRYFEGCLPVEVLAARGEEALAFGPMRPIGLKDPRTGRRPHAVVQLRQDNLAGSLYNMVGFQTNLKYEEQKRVFRLIPGLEEAEFVRYGQMHRNTFIAAPCFAAADSAVPRSRRPAFRRTDHRSRGLSGQHRDRPAGRHQRGQTSRRRAARDTSGDNDAGRSVPLRDQLPT